MSRYSGKGAPPRMIARTTGRIAKKAPNGVGRARELVKRLSEIDARDQLRITEADVDVLDRIASGRPPRNALAIIRGIELKLSYTLSKPKQVIESHTVDGDGQDITDSEWTKLSQLEHEVRGG